MTFQDTLNYLYAQLPMFQRIGAQAFKKDLTNIRKLCAALGNPQDSFASIHIAGTNGKGSVSSMVNSVLRVAGHKVGLYTSPHLRSFTERIRVDGAPVTEDWVVAFVARHKALIEEIRPSFFEVTVAMAFEYFREMKIDYAVVEVGMGGRLDSTNILSPIAGAITNISLDHVQHLGGTRAAIAFEKAGILKPGLSVVIGQDDPETRPVFEGKAAEVGADLRYGSSEFTVEMRESDLYGQDFRVRKEGADFDVMLRCGLAGHYQRANVATALTLLQVLQETGITIPGFAIAEGLQEVQQLSGIRGRMTVLQEKPLVLADIGHNAEGVKAVLAQIEATPHRQLHIVWGMANDKDVASMLQLLPRDARYYFVRPDVPRGLDTAELAVAAAEMGLQGAAYASVAAGLAAARAAADAEDLIYVGGSTFVVAEII